MKKNKSKRRQRIFALVVCVCLLCSMFVVSSHAETVTDLTNTTWSWNFDNVSCDFIDATQSGVSKSITYTSNGQTFSSMTFSRWHSGDINQVYFGSNEVWFSDIDGSIYRNEPLYQTFTITGGTAVTDSTLISWITSNATPVDPPPSVDDIMDDSGDALTEILSELGDVAETIIDTPILLIMCIGLPVISFVVGLLARLKDRV